MKIEVFTAFLILCLLGGTQFLIGVLTIIIGIVCLFILRENFWVINTGCTLWTGAWIVATGILCMCAGRYHHVHSLVGVTLSFNILATIVTFLDGIFFVMALM